MRIKARTAAEVLFTGLIIIFLLLFYNPKEPDYIGPGSYEYDNEEIDSFNEDELTEDELSEADSFTLDENDPFAADFAI